ncbi:hypothetical protein OH807_02270 [Kitasatospora sp. NBC_01560]|uniref:hypothetical protein n=1 Tax=Kitasatospora sp. NBC_01560 TaxID=2975965 RepID=UPI003868A499
MSQPPADHDSSEDRFAGIGDPTVAAVDERRGLLAVAGVHEDEHEGDEVWTIGVFDVRGHARLRRLVHSGFPVHALAFHPTRLLLAVGAGAYDGGYSFEGELLLVDLADGTVRSLIAHDFGRHVLGLEWLDDRRLRVLMAPPDDWKDRKAHVEGHVAVLSRDDWSVVGARSVTGHELAGPRVPVPRPDGREAARTLVARTAARSTRRHHRTGTHG